ncbi:hypothetical protein D3C79_983470 [compost metagenome]
MKRRLIEPSRFSLKSRMRKRARPASTSTCGFSGYVSIGNLAMGMFRHRFMETLTVSHRQRVTIDPHRPTQGQRCIK